MSEVPLKKGDIYLCEFGEGVGSQQGGTRPVVIVQNDIGNHFSPTTIVLGVTSKKKKKYPTHIELKKGTGGLTEDSTVLGEQIFTIDKSRLIKRMGTISHRKDTMNDLETILLASLGIIRN